MADSEDWSFPDEMQPQPQKLRFALDPVLDAMVSLRAEIPGDAFTAQLLGTERGGNGIVIDDGMFSADRVGPGYDDPEGPGYSYLAPSGALSVQWNTSYTQLFSSG